MDDQTRDLFAACGADGWGRIREMLAAAPELVNARNAEGKALLHLTILGGDAPHLQWLLEAGADANAVSDSGRSPLALAVESSHAQELVSLLLEHGADPDAVDHDGFSALERAIDAGFLPPICALLEAGARVIPTGDRKNYPLLQAAFHGMALAGNRLIAAGASVSDGPAVWLQPLHVAARRGHLGFVDLLVRHGADLEAPGREDCCLGLREGSWEQQSRKPWPAHGSPVLTSPLGLAARGGHLAVCEYLLRAGADPNRRGISADTPLIRAAARGNAGLAELLLDHGALANLGTKSGISPLLAAVAQDQMAVVSLLLARGAVANVADENGWTPLHQAAVDSTPGMVGMLLSKDASVYALDDRGRTPLRVAAEMGHAQAVRELLAAGSPVNLDDIEGNSPLHAAAMAGHVGSVLALLEGGACVAARNGTGLTPHDVAIEAGHTILGGLLLGNDTAGDGVDRSDQW